VQHLLSVVEAKCPEWYVLVRMGIATGMRMGELAALRYQDINWRDGYVNVTSNYVQGKWTTPKNGKTRTVALSHRVASLSCCAIEGDGDVAVQRI
jgi:integrase